MDETDAKSEIDANRNDDQTERESDLDTKSRRESEAKADDVSIDVDRHSSLPKNTKTLPADDTCDSNEENVHNDKTSVSEEIDHSFAESCIQIHPDCTNKLTNGLMQNILPELEKAKTSIEEAIKNQDVLIETVQQENAKFVECNSVVHLVDMMHEAKTYYNKLIIVKKDMVLLTDRTSKLKRRAVKLQQQKQKEEQYQIQCRERELEKEQQLIARVVKKTDAQ